MEAVLFSDKQGTGYISTDDIIDDKFKPLKVEFEFGIIEPGTLTDLGGFFSKEFKYIGCKGSEMLFFITKETSLFGTKYYYQAIHRISPTRIFLKYTDISGRDYNFINGKFK